MPQLKSSRESKPWHSQRVGITGGARQPGPGVGERVSGGRRRSDRADPSAPPTEAIPAIDRWVSWTCGREMDLEAHLLELDVLVLNHGVNPQGDQSAAALSELWR